MLFELDSSSNTIKLLNFNELKTNLFKSFEFKTNSIMSSKPALLRAQSQLDRNVKSNSFGRTTSS